ncbi:MAG TPA: alpha/beta hydrolase [Polyangiaceae bacterium]|nr:alpha/beta hydrolase [Polyangiaceae bacterium]
MPNWTIPLDSSLPRAGRGNRLPAWKRWLSLQAYGLFTSTLFRAHTSPQALRARFERFGHTSREALQRKRPGLVFEDHALGPLEMESVKASPAPQRVVLHLHGGGFVFGSTASYRNRAMRLSYRFDAEVFVPDYRLAPEHAFPAALDDALSAYHYVRALHPHTPLILSGDSAGGGLALSVMLRLRALAEPLPAGAILLSPWTDLSASGASVRNNHGKDLWLRRAHLEQWGGHYAGAIDRCTPLMSPVFADLSGLPAMLLLAGEDEILLDDAKRVAESAVRAGSDARLLVGKGMQHDWPLTLPWLDESREAWETMRRFVEERCRCALATCVNYKSCR